MLLISRGNLGAAIWLTGLIWLHRYEHLKDLPHGASHGTGIASLLFDQPKPQPIQRHDSGMHTRPSKTWPSRFSVAVPGAMVWASGRGRLKHTDSLQYYTTIIIELGKGKESLPSDPPR